MQCELKSLSTFCFVFYGSRHKAAKVGLLLVVTALWGIVSLPQQYVSDMILCKITVHCCQML